MLVQEDNKKASKWHWRFETEESANTVNSKPIYRKKEYSFDFEPTGSCDIYLVVNYLQIGFGLDNNYLKEVWGFCPYMGWIEKRLFLPVYSKGHVILKHNIETGSIVRMGGHNEWSIYYDKTTGWVCAGEYRGDSEATAIEFAKDAIAVVRENELIAIWLKPDMIE